MDSKLHIFEKVIIAIDEQSWNEDIHRYIAVSKEEGLLVKYEWDESDSPEVTLVITDSECIARKAKEAGYAVLGYDGCKQVKYTVDELAEVDDYYMNEIFLRSRELPVTIATTDRTIIREMTTDDLPAMYELYNQPNVKRFTEPLYEYEEELEFSKAYIKNMYGFYGYGQWLVFEKCINSDGSVTEGQLIGRAGLSNREINGENRVELGYLIHDGKTRQGLGYEVCRAIIKYARDNLKLNELFVCAKSENEASLALATKLGFEPWGEAGDLKLLCLYL